MYVSVLPAGSCAVVWVISLWVMRFRRVVPLGREDGHVVPFLLVGELCVGWCACFDGLAHDICRAFVIA